MYLLPEGSKVLGGPDSPGAPWGVGPWAIDVAAGEMGS